MSYLYSVNKLDTAAMCLGCYNLAPSGLLNHVVPSVLASNCYVENFTYFVSCMMHCMLCLHVFMCMHNG